MDQETLEELQQAADAVTQANDALRAVVVRATSAPNANITAIADAAKVTRQTVYRWRDEADPDGEPADPVTALDDALRALLAAGVGPVHEVHAGLGTSNRAAKARRVLLVARNTAPAHRVSDELRTAIEAGCVVAHRVLGSNGRDVSAS